MEWAIALGAIVGLWIYAKAFGRVYFGQDGKISVTQFTKLDAVLALFVLAYIVYCLLPVPPGAKTVELIKQDARVILLGGVIYYVPQLLMIAMFLSVRRITLSEVFRFDKMTWPQALRRGLVFFVCAAALFSAAGSLVYWWWNIDRTPNQQEFISLFEQSTSAQRMALVVVSVIVAPVAEEVVFRGYLYGVTKRVFGGVPALAITGIVFAVSHNNIPSVLPIFIFACCLTIAYETTGNLGISMAIHAGCNAVNLLIAAFQ
jgi:membrane protease YdiL (CAAX protease family)